LAFSLELGRFGGHREVRRLKSKRVYGRALEWLCVISVLSRARIARVSALGAGAVVLVWILVQVSIIGYVSWMQPVTAIGGLLILLLSVLLPGRVAPAHDAK
jgi:hypothetical protein